MQRGTVSLSQFTYSPALPWGGTGRAAAPVSTARRDDAKVKQEFFREPALALNSTCHLNFKATVPFAILPVSELGRNGKWGDCTARAGQHWGYPRVNKLMGTHTDTDTENHAEASVTLKEDHAALAGS
ncbi:hypothetical protein chiPu_0011079 [Chiloscyllium punctatum]|uniref:Uncharacterized protein n=1 Tax=Chiloscyllium punctatum TaxID=137246 RepID=A0A401SQG5_CHIPU|nr:hypothetical protein [Chiloscyllium punctatum]